MFMEGVDRKANLSKEPKLSEFLFSQLDRQEYNLKLEQELEQKSTKENSESKFSKPFEIEAGSSENENSSLENAISKYFGEVNWKRTKTSTVVSL